MGDLLREVNKLMDDAIKQDPMFLEVTVHGFDEAMKEMKVPDLLTTLFHMNLGQRQAIQRLAEEIESL